MTDGLKVSPSDWGGSAGGGVESLSPVQSSPKEQRSQRRSSMPAAQLHGDAGPQPGVGVGGPHLLEGDHLVDLDQTPTMIPEVHYHTPVVHVAQWTEVRYGRRGRRPRGAFHQVLTEERLGTGARGMDNAFQHGYLGGPER
ncbi:hypothetical protein Q5P01_000003 [Channa striata]|uniref:Uncharacterized protein n=1 Tax=Channa striata TaxID=64152 RepID=A0AA88IR39_CHASR|nr:hypothetical protein Q5P01_000003 [Channa striata]